MNQNGMHRLVVVAVLALAGIGQAGAVRDADPTPVSDAALDITSVSARRMERGDGRLVFEVATRESPRVENLRILLDTDPSAGDAETGADFMMEGRRFYRRPEGARGWQWDEIESPAIASDGRSAICVLPPLPELARGSWIVQATGERLETLDRVPEEGSIEYALADLESWEPPFRAGASDMQDLLDLEDFSLSVRLDTEIKAIRWEAVSEGAPALAWTPVNCTSPVPLRVLLEDAETRESAALVPGKAWRAGEVVRYEGRHLGVSWTLLVEPAETGSVRITGKLSDERDRCLRVEVQSPLDLPEWVWHDDFRTRRRLAEADGALSNTAPSPFGERSMYPFGVVSRDETLLLVETDPSEPRVFRTLARKDGALLCIQYDLALTSQTSNFPGLATFRCEFRSLAARDADPFRVALADFQRRHPGFRMGRRGGVGPANLVRIEPWVQFVEMPAGMARTTANVELLTRLGLMQHGREAELAAATLLGACLRPNGTPAVSYEEGPAANGAQVPVNVDPDTRCAPELPVSRAMAEWRFVREQLENPEVSGFLLGRMEESADYRGAALGVADFPCVFEPRVLKPCVANSFSGWEFASRVNRALVDKGKQFAGTRADDPSAFHAQLLDAVFETLPWIKSGEWNPGEHRRLVARRVIAGAKPVTWVFEAPEDQDNMDGRVERAFAESLFWGCVPLLAGDRVAGESYAPLAQRLALAGWDPVGFASAEPETVVVEHFGVTQAVRHVTIRNEDRWITDATLRVNTDTQRVVVFNPLNGNCTLAGESVAVRLMPGEVQVVDVFAPGDMDRELEFFREAGGFGAGEACLRTLESVRAELKAGLECDLRYPVPCVTDEANRLELVVRNAGSEAARLRGLRVIGRVFRESPALDAEIAAGSAVTAAVHFMTADLPETGWFEVDWQATVAGGALTCTRFIRPRVADAIELHLPAEPVEAEGLEKDVELIVVNHSTNTRPFTLTWQGAFRGGSKHVRFAPVSREIYPLSVRARRPASGEMYAILERDEEQFAVVRFEVVFQAGPKR